jgi:hypothetical protein
LTEIGEGAFKEFAGGSRGDGSSLWYNTGDLIIEGKCPSLQRIGSKAFFYSSQNYDRTYRDGNVPDLSSVDLSELQSLVEIGQRAFEQFFGALTLTGRCPNLIEIGFQAFHFAKNPNNIINIQCISPNGLTFVESTEEGLTNSFLEEAAFSRAFGDVYIDRGRTIVTGGQQNLNPPPRGCGVYTCDAALGDVPLTKALYASINAGEVAGGFNSVTCIPSEEFMDHDAPLSLSERMPNVISIGDRAFFRFNGGGFTFQSLDETYLPRLEHIGVEAFAQFVAPATTSFDMLDFATIQLRGTSSLISIGDSAFSTWNAHFMLLEVECACPNLEVIGELVFATLEYRSNSKITFTNLSRLRTIGASAFANLGSRDAANQHGLFVSGVSPLLTIIGAAAFR